MDRESQTRQKSLLAWCMIYYNLRVSFDCGRPGALLKLISISLSLQGGGGWLGMRQQ